MKRESTTCLSPNLVTPEHIPAFIQTLVVTVERDGGGSYYGIMAHGWLKEGGEIGNKVNRAEGVSIMRNTDDKQLGQQMSKNDHFTHPSSYAKRRIHSSICACGAKRAWHRWTPRSLSTIPSQSLRRLIGRGNRVVSTPTTHYRHKDL